MLLLLNWRRIVKRRVIPLHLGFPYLPVLVRVRSCSSLECETPDQKRRWFQQYVELNNVFGESEMPQHVHDGETLTSTGRTKLWYMGLFSVSALLQSAKSQKQDDCEQKNTEHYAPNCATRHRPSGNIGGVDNCSGVASLRCRNECCDSSDVGKCR